MPLLAASSALSSSAFGDAAVAEGLLAGPASFPWLSLITLLPVAVAPLLMLLPGDGTDPKLPRTIALVTLLVDLGLMLFVFSQHYDGSIAGLQLVERFAWVPAIGLEWSLATDGLSAPLVVLSGLVTLLSVAASWNIQKKHASISRFSWYRPLPRRWCSSPRTSCSSSWPGNWSWCRCTC
jgi:NAD(P)H-quinone oxidoreductase subunit 4